MPYVFNPFTGTLDWTSAADVTGPSSSTDNALARFDGTTGKLIKNSSATLTDAGALSAASLTLSNIANTGVVFGNFSNQLTTSQSKIFWDDTRTHFGVANSVNAQITNGTFSGNASGWTLPTGWAYGSNAVSHNANGTGALSQNITTPVLGDRWELKFTISNLTAGTVSAAYQGFTWGANLSQNGTYIYRGIITNSSNSNFTNLTFTPSNTARFTIDDVSLNTYVGGTIRTGDLQIAASNSNTDGVLTITSRIKNNGLPGDTRHISLQNNGGYTWIDFQFSGTNQAHIGATSSGEVSTWIGGTGNGASVYHKATNTLVSYNNPSTFTHYGYGAFLNGVNAGGASSPSSTLMSQGGTALKVKYITANQTLDNTATEWIVDPSTATCTGAPTNACSSYTTEATCLARDAHGGCSWFAGYDCSVYNGDESSCTGQTGCTWEQSSCSVYNNNQSSCEGQTGCSWNNNPQDCSTLNETACGSTSGCTQNFDDCANYSDGGGDGTACNAANGGGYCSYDSGTGACTGGSWYVSCSGTYDSYTCDGTYATGNCTGVYGAACSGSASCGGIDDQTNCNAESGCTWQTAITLTLPSITTCPDRDYWIYNTSSTNADVVLVPSSGDTVDHTTSYTLSNYKDWVHVSPFRRLEACSSFNEATCGSTSGCTQNYSNCVWDGSTCGGNASCTGYGDQSSCESATYYSGCSGNYLVSSNWYVFGK